ncbi:hypothetical protein [Clostridium sp.]|uniref:hypothetical protein n=1 Tax=Clostridium sp. TaxID=1506 RepID=UPI003463D818
MKKLKLISNKIKSIPMVLSIIFLTITILNSLVPSVVTSREEVSYKLNRLEYILDNTEFKNNKLEPIDNKLDFSNEKEIYFNGKEEEIKEKNYINITSNNTVLAFNGNEEIIEYTDGYTKERLGKEIQDIIISYHLMRVVSSILGILLRLALVYLAITTLTQYLTKRRIKVKIIFKYLTVSSVISSLVSFIVWRVANLGNTTMDFISLILISIIFSVLIKDEVRKCVTSDYTGEGNGLDDIY